MVDFESKLIPKTKSGKILYSIAYNYLEAKTKNWIPALLYLHAEDIEDARLQFFRGETEHARMNVVGIAPVIGYFAEDDNADVVSV